MAMSKWEKESAMESAKKVVDHLNMQINDMHIRLICENSPGEYIGKLNSIKAKFEKLYQATWTWKSLTKEFNEAVKEEEALKAGPAEFVPGLVFSDVSEAKQEEVSQQEPVLLVDREVVSSEQVQAAFKDANTPKINPRWRYRYRRADEDVSRRDPFLSS